MFSKIRLTIRVETIRANARTLLKENIKTKSWKERNHIKEMQEHKQKRTEKRRILFESPGEVIPLDVNTNCKTVEECRWVGCAENILRRRNMYGDSDLVTCLMWNGEEFVNRLLYFFISLFTTFSPWFGIRSYLAC